MFELWSDIADAMQRSSTLTKTYPGYLASCIKRALKAGTCDSEEVFSREIGDIITVASSKYEIAVTDFNGTKYRVTVEVEGGK